MTTETKTEFKVGAVVVVFYCGSPVLHNSSAKGELGGSGCRGRITKIGRRNIYVSSRGADIKCDGTIYEALPIGEAKQQYRDTLQRYPNGSRTPQQIERYVDGL